MKEFRFLKCQLRHPKHLKTPTISVPPKQE